MTGSPMAQSSLNQMCPSAAVVLQSQCHKGRESKVDMVALLSGQDSRLFFVQYSL